MSFFGNKKLNPFIEKMEKGELTLEDILNEDSIIQDIRTHHNSKFISFFTKEKIQKLIDYSTKFPSEDNHNVGYKYPFNATEILCSENLSFQKKLMTGKTYIKNDEDNINEKIKRIKKESFLGQLFSVINHLKNGLNIEKKEEEERDNYDYESEEDEENEEINKNGNTDENKNILYENIDYLLLFLKEPEKTLDNYILVGYFSKILNSLINIHQMKIVQYLLDYPKKVELDILDLLVKHMNRKSMCNIIQKLLMFDHELISKYEDKKIDLLSKVLDELDKSEQKEKYEFICQCICSTMNNRQFFDLLMKKKEILEKIYKIIFNCKNNDSKYNSILKLLIKINVNILQHFSVRFTDNNDDNDNDNDLTTLNADPLGTLEKSVSSPVDTDLLKKYLLALFDILENNKFSFFEDFGNFNANNNDNKNDVFISTYIEKQKKIGLKNILQTQCLKTLIDIFVNSYASKYHENKIEQLIKIGTQHKIFWNLHDLFLDFPFSNIFQIYYDQIMKIVLNENSPNCIIDAFFIEIDNKKRNLIDILIDKILSDMKFTFKLTNTKAFNPLLPFIITILNKIYTSQNLYVKSFIEKNKNISVFYEVIGQETESVFNQKLLLTDNNLEGHGIGETNETFQIFGAKNLLEVFEENSKIYEMYKRGEDYKKALKEKKERIEKEKEDKKEEEKNDKKKVKKSLEFMEEYEEEDDPLFKVEKINSEKDKDNFLAILNKPAREVNLEEGNKDVIVDNIDKGGELKHEQIGRTKELLENNDDKEGNKQNNSEIKLNNNEKEKNKNIENIGNK